MKTVNEKLQIFSMLKRPSETENVPQKITLRDKLTPSSQILAQTLATPDSFIVCFFLLICWFFLSSFVDSQRILLASRMNLKL